MKRILLAAILGGLTLFVWMYVAHDLLGLGEMGVGEIPNEAVVLNAMRGAITEPGFYIFPGVGLGPKATVAERKAAMPEYMKKYEQSPHGILVYHPASGPFQFGTALGREFALNVLQALLAAWLVAGVASGRGYSARVGVVVVAGVLAALSTNVEYWNWYGFPGNYITGYMTTQIVGFVLAGFVIAALVRNRTAAAS
ncbi:MAG TPA: hypothetical protein VNY81_03900 [Candidatus Saccharimonadales bacterium]|jgi:hypothetical protein|nr:hypothetical protein [Candidatus Saccharimonadales bacterium]